MAPKLSTTHGIDPKAKLSAEFEQGERDLQATIDMLDFMDENSEITVSDGFIPGYGAIKIFESDTGKARILDPKVISDSAEGDIVRAVLNGQADARVSGARIKWQGKLAKAAGLSLAAMAMLNGCSPDMGGSSSSPDSLSQSDASSQADAAPNYASKASSLTVEETAAIQEAVAPLWANMGAEMPNIFEVSPGVILVTLIEDGAIKYIFGKAGEEKTAAEDLKTKDPSNLKTVQFPNELFEGAQWIKAGVFTTDGLNTKIGFNASSDAIEMTVVIDPEEETVTAEGDPQYMSDIYGIGPQQFSISDNSILMARMYTFDLKTSTYTPIDSEDITQNDMIHCGPGHLAASSGLAIQSKVTELNPGGLTKCKLQIAEGFENMDNTILLPQSLIAINNSSPKITNPRFIPGAPGEGGLMFVKYVFDEESGEHKPQIMIAHVEMPVGPECGDATCEDPETFVTCPEDCEKPAECGDTLCEPDKGENLVTCESDCHECGDGTCSTADEDYTNCPEDCEEPGPVCGDSACEDPETFETCPLDCEKPAECGDEVCETEKGETKENCGQDCDQCGDGTCGTSEDKEICLDDCAVCDDAVCDEPVETPGNCPEDCEVPAVCGDTQCETDKGETLENCGKDCDQCGDGTCGTSESKEVCLEDCASCGDEVCDDPLETTENCEVDCPKPEPITFGLLCDQIKERITFLNADGTANVDCTEEGYTLSGDFSVMVEIIPGYKIQIDIKSTAQGEGKFYIPNTLTGTQLEAKHIAGEFKITEDSDGNAKLVIEYILDGVKFTLEPIGTTYGVARGVDSSFPDSYRGRVSEGLVKATRIDPVTGSLSSQTYNPAGGDFNFTTKLLPEEFNNPANPEPKPEPNPEPPAPVEPTENAEVNETEPVNGAEINEDTGPSQAEQEVVKPPTEDEDPGGCMVSHKPGEAPIALYFTILALAGMMRAKQRRLEPQTAKSKVEA